VTFLFFFLPFFKLFFFFIQKSPPMLVALFLVVIILLDMLTPTSSLVPRFLAFHQLRYETFLGQFCFFQLVQMLLIWHLNHLALQGYLGHLDTLDTLTDVG